MTQEELAQLKELLNKAQTVFPGAQHFYVGEKNGTYFLEGIEIHIVLGEVTSYLLDEQGLLKKDSSPVY